MSAGSGDPGEALGLSERELAAVAAMADWCDGEECEVSFDEDDETGARARAAAAIAEGCELEADGDVQECVMDVAAMAAAAAAKNK